MQYSREQIIDEIKSLILKNFDDEIPGVYTMKKDPKPITEDTRFGSDLNIDSFSLGELGYEAEVKYGIKNLMSDEDIYTAQTIGDLADAVQKTLQKKEG